MKIKLYRYVLSVLFISVIGISNAQAAQNFKFENHESLQDMQKFIAENFQVGTEREKLIDAFVANGKATMIQHPSKPYVEKYIYDINLCGYYIWRWNISADYSQTGTVRQIYMNGNPVLADGTPKQKVSTRAEEGKKSSILKGKRPRPEAGKGENSLAFIVFDRDGDIKTIDDQMAIGSGPSKADPLDMGKMVIYKEVDPWRSIFDFDDADFIAPYSGDCQAVDAAIVKQHPTEKHEHKGVNSGSVTNKLIEGRSK